MSKITALILAAGLGVRMGPRGTLTPKGLIEMGGVGLVPQSVDSLRRWGVDRIVIVTGHLAEQYESTFAGHDVELIHNSDYQTTGSLLTLSKGLDVIEGPCVILESDLIYAPQVLDGVRRGQDCFMVSGPTGAGDEVYTWFDADAGNRMQLISKQLSDRSDTPAGEMIGVTGLSGESVENMRDVAARVYARSPGAHYEDGLVELSKTTPIECVLFPEIPWAEIDDEDMLAAAARDVFPKILAARKAAWS